VLADGETDRIGVAYSPERSPGSSRLGHAQGE